jgi:hypothetical protein
MAPLQERHIPQRQAVTPVRLVDFIMADYQGVFVSWLLQHGRLPWWRRFARWRTQVTEAPNVITRSDEMERTIAVPE